MSKTHFYAESEMQVYPRSRTPVAKRLLAPSQQHRFTRNAQFRSVSVIDIVTLD